MKLTVLIRFRDKYIPGVYYNPGDVIEIDDPERVKDLMTRKEPLVKMAQETVISAVNINQSAAKIKDEVLACSDLNVLKDALQAEQNSEKPRKGVIQTINDRISEL